MGDTAKKAATDATDAGWSALADGRWEDAHALFERALDEDETPEALEGLGWSAWWLDDAETVFDARERAYRLYRKRGDPASAARIATWIAADQLDSDARSGYIQDLM